MKKTFAFFIVGSGRSGTTLLRRLLMTRSNVYIPPETYVLGEVIRAFPLVRHLGWDATVCYVASKFEYHSEFRHFGIASLRSFAADMFSCPVEHQSLARLLDALFRHFGQANGFPTSRWGDKTPYNTFFLPELKSVFPKGKFIFSVRDGCDVVYSMLRAGRCRDATSAAMRWREANAAALKFEERHPECVMTIRYEGLVTDPERCTKAAIEFLGLEPCSGLDERKILAKMGDVNALDHHRNVINPVDSSRTGAGRLNLSAQEKQAIEPIIAPMLSLLGYEPDLGIFRGSSTSRCS
jgi:protein-tyrosine sulfotransferase